MRIAGATSVAKSTFAGLSMLLALGVGAEAGAGTIVRERYPQDGFLLDLISRSTRDPDLLTPRQATLQAHLRNMGVDALERPMRPSIATAASLAVPTPASTMTGTLACSMMMRRL